MRTNILLLSLVLLWNPIGLGKTLTHQEIQDKAKKACKKPLREELPAFEAYLTFTKPIKHKRFRSQHISISALQADNSVEKKTLYISKKKRTEHAKFRVHGLREKDGKALIKYKLARKTVWKPRGSEYRVSFETTDAKWTPHFYEGLCVEIEYKIVPLRIWWPTDSNVRRPLSLKITYAPGDYEIDFKVNLKTPVTQTSKSNVVETEILVPIHEDLEIGYVIEYETKDIDWVFTKPKKTMWKTEMKKLLIKFD